MLTYSSQRYLQLCSYNDESIEHVFFD